MDVLEKSSRIISRPNMYKIFLVINVFAAIFRFSIFPNKSIQFHLILFFVSSLLFILVWEFIQKFHRWVSTKIPLDEKPITNVAIQIVFGYILGASALRTMLSYSTTFLGEREATLLKTLSLLVVFFLISIIYLILIGSYFFYQWKENLLKNENLKREQAQVKFDALKNQVNPHFLFNALASLDSLIFENQELASEFLQQLSKVYRYILQNKEKPTVSLDTEIDFVKNYISLQQIRFKENLEFEISIDDADYDKEIVPISIQILVENVIKHNIINNQHQMKISIVSDGDYLNVSNTFIPKEQIETSNKQGLENLKNLYRYLTTKVVEAKMENNQFTVKIPLI